MPDARGGIDDVDRALIEWVANVVEQVEVTLEPKSARTGQGVCLQLVALASAPPPRGQKRSPHQVLLRYQLTTWAERPEHAHKLLSDLLFAALERSDLEVDLAPMPHPTNGLPVPGFILQVPLHRERPEARATLVRGPLKVVTSPARPMFGVVLGPQDFPMVGALVELPSLDLSSRTDHLGRFSFAAVPSGTPPLTLRVRAKGAVQVFTAPVVDEAVTIRFELKEV